MFSEGHCLDTGAAVQVRVDLNTSRSFFLLLGIFTLSGSPYTGGEHLCVFCLDSFFYIVAKRLAPSLKEGATEHFCVCVCGAECVLGDASGCGDRPSGGLFLAGPAGHRHEAEDQGPPDEGGERATRCVFTWIQSRRSEVCVRVCVQVIRVRAHLHNRVKMQRLWSVI